jgi:uncharacterized protein (TIGR03067 family)
VKEITLVGPEKDMTRAGIYALDGDGLKICFNTRDDAKQPRPTEFKTVKGDGRVLLVLKREKK